MPVTPEDVSNAYRWLLGREPDEQGRSAWLGVQSREELRQAFVASPEFRNATLRLPPLPSHGAAAARVPRLLSFNDIEWRADAAADVELTEYIQRTWNRLGVERPHWSVLSADRFQPENIDANRASFYGSGSADVELIMNILNNNEIDVGSIRSVVEYGCGVGRVTPYLAAKFQRVTAIDISESHLAMARHVCAGISAVEFAVAHVPHFGMAAPFDLWFSYIVLQHNPPPIIAHILARAFKLLAPGGIAIFQVPTWCHNYRFRVAGYLASRPAEPTIEVHCLPQRVIFELAHQAGCVPIEVRDDTAMAPPAWASRVFALRKAGA